MLKFLTHKLRTHSLNEDPNQEKVDDDHDSGTESDDEFQDGGGIADEPSSPIESPGSPGLTDSAVPSDTDFGASPPAPFGFSGSWSRKQQQQCESSEGLVEDVDVESNERLLAARLQQACQSRDIPCHQELLNYSNDQHSSEEELEVINSPKVVASQGCRPATAPEKRKWSQVSSGGPQAHCSGQAQAQAQQQQPQQQQQQEQQQQQQQQEQQQQTEQQQQQQQPQQQHQQQKQHQHQQQQQKQQQEQQQQHEQQQQQEQEHEQKQQQQQQAVLGDDAGAATASCSAPVSRAGREPAGSGSSDEEVQGLLGGRSESGSIISQPVQFRTSPPVDAHKPGRSLSPPPKLFHASSRDPRPMPRPRSRPRPHPHLHTHLDHHHHHHYHHYHTHHHHHPADTDVDALSACSPRKRHRPPHRQPRPCLDFEKMQQLKARAVTAWRHSGEHGNELSVFCW